MKNLLAQESTAVPTTGTSVITQTDPGFNLWWLLPLLAIPLILFAMRDRGDRDRTTILSGTKGGRTRDKDEM